MTKILSPIPRGYHSLTPHLVMRGAKEALEFYQKAFDAEVISFMNRSDGKIMHAELKIGDSVLMIAEECSPHEGHETKCVRSPADLKGTTTNLYLYVKDADKVFNNAVGSGAAVIMPVADMFWGDRIGVLQDPFGHSWSVATHKEDLSPDEIKQNAEKFFSQNPTCG